MPRFKFHHGLGDCANAAHLFKLYTSRGIPIEVDATPDKAPLFLAAGCTVVQGADAIHNWDHAPAPGNPEHSDPWSGNKTAWNISRNPLPDIGGYWERWPELAAVRLDLDPFVTPEVELTVDRLIRDLPRPLVLFHPQGNTGQESKNLSHEVQAEVIRGILDRTDASVITLDWDNRVYKLNNYRVRHLTDDLQRLGTVELYRLIQRADLLLGADSGPLHLTRFTDTPALGCWTHHFPSHYALPRGRTANIVPRGNRWREWVRYRRLSFNVLECPSERINGGFIAEQAARLLSAPVYVQDGTADVLLQTLVDKLRQFDSPLTGFIDRHRSVDKFLKLAKGMNAPNVLETGCIRSPDDWTAGFSSYLFGLFLRHHGGRLTSIDLDPVNVAFARSWTAGMPVEVVQGHSHEVLAGYTGPALDLVYLDSADTGTPGYQECCLEEARLILPRLAARCAVLVDDTCYGAGQLRGKGTLAVPFLLTQGFRVAYGGYQVLLTRGLDEARA